MLAVERRKKIAELINEKKSVLVTELSRLLEVTEETIRRDLERLEKQGILVRTHGGATLTDNYASEAPVEERKVINYEGKDAIGKAAAQLIKDGETIFLDASTSSLFVARHIKTRKGITVITNSSAIIAELAQNDGIDLICVGGILRFNNMSYVGRVAESTIQTHYYANKTFFSCRGITLNRGLTDFSEQEAEIKKVMLKNSDVSVFLCDHSKFGKMGVPVVASLDQIDFFVTDVELDKEWEEVLDKKEIELIVAKV